MIDKFLGDWRISHYVYNANGSFAGILRERRTLESQGEGRVRVVSQIEPSHELARHAVQQLAGEWVHEIDTNENLPRQLPYRGYPIIGSEINGKRLDWGWNTITEHGQWGAFAFTAFGALINPQRQVIATIFEPTGVRKITFRPQSDTYAKMIGIAVPSEEDYPEFTGAQKAQEVAELWRGAWQTFNVDGELEAIEWVERRYLENGWEEYTEGELSNRVTGSESLSREGTEDALRQFHRYGWTLEFLASTFLDFSTEQIEILDNTSQTLIALRRTTYYGNAPLFESRIELAFLKPIE
jgi:hypothetical protein